MNGRKKGTFWMAGGLLLLVTALFLTLYNLREASRAEEESAEAVAQLVEEIIGNKESEDTSKLNYQEFPEKEMPTAEIDGYRYIGILEIPQLDLTLPVMAAEWNYDKLSKAPCLYSGSVYQDNAVIVAHNYVSHFGNLTRLSVGDEVYFTDVDGNTFTYETGWMETLNANEVDAMCSGEDWDLTLYTCNYSGRQRYTVRCIKR